MVFFGNKCCGSVQVCTILFDFRSYLDDQGWICQNEGDCRPKKGIEADIVYENQNICRLLCGKYGGLWPKPTVQCNLGKSIIDVNTELIR